MSVKERIGRAVPSLLVAMVGVALLRITIASEVYLQYVKEGLRVPLIIAGGLLLLLGVAGLVRQLTRRRTEPVLVFRRGEDGTAHWQLGADGDEHDHDHEHSPRVAWLLAVPAVLLLCFTPPALGAYTASRDGADATVQQAAYQDLPQQPAAADPATQSDSQSSSAVSPMSLTEFIGRSRDPKRSLAGRKVKLTGFVTPGAQQGEWYLNRLVVSCCAADARRLRILVHTKGPTPATESWVELTGTWMPAPDAPATAAPQLDLLEQHSVPQPRAPYRDLPPTES
ncbi:TIGR03943 family protein [Streptomyces sp. XY431]|uniref:TIGR03943 family putative permease subunit n=1 Tax=Streptomyces sp. XY431 TaxID=1415562 RepID=UPI0006AE0545|nr:TIGR03943 family protein [Streptomyces sp. XY431]